jgi:hypothetical protein
VVPSGEHSPLGPSSSKRWMHCAGSVHASKDAPDDESTYAAEGTAAHYLSELVRKTGRPPEEWMGNIFVVGKHKFKIDEEFCDSVTEFVEWCAAVPSDVTLIEQRIDYSAHAPRAILDTFGKTFGTLDDARIKDHWCTITDFKHGKGVQEFAKDNTQLMLQALGVYEDYDWAHEINAFVLRISQPRLGHKDEWTIHTSQLLEWAKFYLPGYWERVLLGADFEAGTWCQFCRIRRTCAVRQNSSIQLVLGEGTFENLDAKELEQSVVAAKIELPAITTERRKAILPLLPMLKAWIKEFEKDTVAKLIAGEDLGGWKLVEGRSNRQWSDEDRAYEVLVDAGVEPWEKKLLSPSKAEKAMGKKAFKELPEGLVKKPPGKPRLAPPTDPKPAITTTAALEFDNLEDDG